MDTVVAIVEGDGEVDSLPILLRRLSQWKTPEAYVDVAKPIRVHRDSFLNKPVEFGRFLQLAGKKCGEHGFILILLDADDDCPAKLGADILARAHACVPHRQVSVVLANREYEAWFIAAAQSLNGKRGFVFDSGSEVDAERPRDAKGWIKKHMRGGSYGAITDQAGFSALMDLQQAFDNSRSFRKLCGEWLRQVGGAQ
jgi:Domain of unknown function (DUF4276)